MKSIDDLIRELGKRDKRKRKRISVTESKLLMKDIDTKFLTQIQKLSMEELIAIKIESMASITNGKLYFPMRKILFNIMQRALVLIALSATGNTMAASILLGTPSANLKKLIWRYKLENGEDTEKFTRENSFNNGERIED